MALDAAAIRRDFPILSRTIHGRRLVYLDNAATTQKPRAVIDALVEFYERHNANIHRGIHTLAEEATELYEGVRERTAAFAGVPADAAVVFTRNATEAINLVRYAWARTALHAGDEIVLTVMEHHSNFVPWIHLAGETGVVLKHVRLNYDGTLDLDHYRSLLSPRTKLVTVAQVSNVLGTINPVREIAHEAHQVGSCVLVDAAQSVPHMPVSFADLGCDFLAFSAHKMLGPTGVGVLAARKDLLERMEPFNAGGSMIREVGLQKATWAEVPWKFEGGTPNIAGVVAFGAALDYLGRLGMAEVRAHEAALTAYALDRLKEVPGLTIYGPPDAAGRGGVISFTMGTVHPHDLAQVLDREGIAIRAGHHCAQPLMRALGTSSTARASFYVYNDRDDVDVLIEGLRKAREFFGPA